MDPRLLSVHLEGNPRREAFRAARHRLEHAPGSHTLAGEQRLGLGTGSCDLRTLAPGDVPVKAGGIVCWLLDRGRQIPLKIGLNSVGRLPDNDIVIEDPTVSRRHCAILVHSDLTCELHDIASKNGTTLNGKKFQGVTRLQNGDEIGLSERKIIFVTSGGLPTNEPAPPIAGRSNDDCTLISADLR